MTVLSRVIDFGSCRFTNSQRGIVMGTPGYAPPNNTAAIYQ
jgi:serine/threonine protein kinase